MKREMFIGDVGIGGNHPVSIQSMTNTPTGDSEATLGQIRALALAGCQIIRVAVPDGDSLPGLKKIIAHSPLPVVADIHFDAGLAIKSIEAGAAGIRINPGNIGGKERVKAVLQAARDHNVPIRIGVNAGSLEKKYLHHSGSRAEVMVQSVMDKVKFFEDNDFFDMKISLKSSSVRETVTAYRLMDKACDYPLHLGVTEAGTIFSGTIKSVLGIGSLLLEGIGNTIRVSLTAHPVEEIGVAVEILKILGLRDRGVEIISCPTCSRTSVDLIAMARQVEKRLASIQTEHKVTVAVMGCEVNGPGEARDADLGIAFSQRWGFIFKKGEMIEKVAPELAVDRLVELVQLETGPKT